MDDICLGCPKLEELAFHIQHSQPMEYPEVPKSLKDEEKFFCLTRLYLSFWHGGNEKDDFDETFLRFKKYLVEKCPKLKNNINFKHDSVNVEYESQEMTDLKAKCGALIEQTTSEGTETE